MGKDEVDKTVFGLGKPPDLEDVKPQKEDPTPPQEVRAAPPKSKQKKAKTPVEMGLETVTRIATLQQVGKVIVATTNGKGYLAPISTEFVRGQAQMKVSTLDEAYSWEDEIEEMLPDREELKRNIRNSIWISGGFEKGEGRQNRRLDQAWPYRLPE